MTVLLSRTSKLWLSTVDSGVTTPDATNTTQLTVLNGYKLTQDSKIDVLDKFRQGSAPSRMKKRFVKDFDLVNLTFSTYIKPLDTGNVDVPDKFLWDALTNNGTQQLSDRFEIDFLSSSTNVFPALWIYLAIDDDLNEGLYKVGPCYVQSARMQFDINNIVKIDWVVKALNYVPLTTTPAVFLDMSHQTGFLKGRLSKVAFTRTDNFSLPLLSGGITILNKVIRLSTPTVNVQIAPNPRVKVEERDVSGDFSVYLRTGSGFSADLLNDMLNSLSTTNDLANITIDLGSTTGASSRVAIEMPTCLVTLPKLNVGVNTVATTMQIFPQEATHGANDDLVIKIYS